jgi:AcrR family transcriptional regulator
VSNKNYHHGDLKGAIIASARKILNEQGADALSLRAIAADVGVSHMAPYAHFKNKKELFQAIAAVGFNELADTMLANSQAITKAPDLILAYGVTYIEFAIENPQLYRLMLGQVENSGRRNQKNKREQQDEITISLAQPVVSSELEASSKRPFELLQKAFEKVNRKDADMKVKAQALGAWSMVHGMAALIIEGHFSIPDNMSIKDFLAMTAVQTAY